MRLLLDEMCAPTIAEQLRARGHDVASAHDPEYVALEGEPDEEVWATAIADDRVLVTENVQDFRRIEAEALASGQPVARLLFTTTVSSPAATPRRSVALSLRSTRCSPRSRISRQRCS